MYHPGIQQEDLSTHLGCTVRQGLEELFIQLGADVEPRGVEQRGQQRLAPTRAGAGGVGITNRSPHGIAAIGY